MNTKLIWARNTSFDCCNRQLLSSRQELRVTIMSASKTSYLRHDCAIEGHLHSYVIDIYQSEPAWKWRHWRMMQLVRLTTRRKGGEIPISLLLRLIFNCRMSNVCNLPILLLSRTMNVLFFVHWITLLWNRTEQQNGKNVCPNQFGITGNIVISRSVFPWY